VLGGIASDFNPILLEEQIFRFSVASKQVALMIVELSQVSEVNFRVGFFLCNDQGFQKALRFAKSDSGPSFHWESPRSKSPRSSYADVVRVHQPPLSGANVVPLGSNRSYSSQSRQVRNLKMHKIAPASVFSRLQFPRRSVFERIRLPPESNSARNSNFEFSQRANMGGGPKSPFAFRPDTVATPGNFGSNYKGSNLSLNHFYLDRRARIKC
jgi:hypothetical protein